MYKLFLLAGTISGALSVMIGAFGAHALKSKLLANGRLDIFETAVKYQFYHSLALMVLGILMLVKFESKLMDYAGYSFIAGILVFSGSLYILCLTNVGKWGAVTPFGGLFLIAGWLLMFTAILNYK
jgi:uncharacterized membrane protein YgdD (TMEM256/DUF423 family)